VRPCPDPGFEALLDRHAGDSPEVRRAYRRAMDPELGLFDAALR
jgi:thiaminase/transcriptional activator TenA